MKTVKLSAPSVKILPLHFKYGINGSFESWNAFGKWVSELNAKGKKLPEFEKQKVDRLLSGISEPKEKIRILYQYLPKEIKHDGKVMTLNYSAVEKENTIEVTAQYLFKQYIYPPEHYPALKVLYDQMIKTFNDMIVLTKM